MDYALITRCERGIDIPFLDVGGDDFSVGQGRPAGALAEHFSDDDFGLDADVTHGQRECQFLFLAQPGRAAGFSPASRA